MTAVVFNASLAGLTSHPARYGWNWDLVIQAEAGYASFTPGTMEKLLKNQPAVTAWSEFSFAQLPVDGQVIPALGLQTQLGSVQPPTTSGQPVSGPGQIELGSVTLRQLGKKVGDQVQIGIRRAPADGRGHRDRDPAFVRRGRGRPSLARPRRHGHEPPPCRPRWDRPGRVPPKARPFPSFPQQP